MTIKTTRWTLDTCECSYEYQWDDSLPPTGRTHNLSKVVNSCPAHTPIADNNEKFNVASEENRRKNITFGIALERGPATLYDIQQDGSRVLKNNITFSWTWSGVPPDRLLTVTFQGITLTQNQITNIQTFLNTKFGIDKVVIVSG